ncbi:MAG: radical SAM protein [Candidatus Heimdallarchaeota archaeon]|nr:radical SAM protein [Candidatus Heimdallarchaeota archaeon]
MLQNYKYLYGPVPSRRLGKSLGVSPIPPKTCNYSCVYCQIGRTTHYTNTRDDFFPREELLAEIEDGIKKTEFDYITFVGEGEPTLYKSLGWVIQKTKQLTTKPIAVITNGALLYDPEVRKALLQVDVVLPTLDAISNELFKKINRPFRGLDNQKIIDGMFEFRKEFTGEIWMEIMLVKGLNDYPENIAQLKEVLEKMGCEKVFVNVPIRPPAENWVEIPEKQRIIEICQELGATNIAQYESDEGFFINKQVDLEDQILKITTRHPLRETQIIKMLSLSEIEANHLLNEMTKKGLIKKVIHNNRAFWLNAKSKIKR